MAPKCPAPNGTAPSCPALNRRRRNGGTEMALPRKSRLPLYRMSFKYRDKYLNIGLIHIYITERKYSPVFLPQCMSCIITISLLLQLNTVLIRNNSK